MELKLNKGLALDLAGAVSPLAQVVPVPVKDVAIIPDDFPGLTPKLEVKEGDHVKVGQPLIRDKVRESLKVVSPVAGVVKSVVRGERRKIERVVVEAQAEDDRMAYDVKGVDTRQKAMDILAASGMMARMRQRPYDVVPTPGVSPRDIFITALDLAPLAVGFGPLLTGSAERISKGVSLLGLCTDGNVYLSVGNDWTLGDVPGAVMVTVQGKYPASNAGVQAANIAPVNKGEVIWTLDAATLCKIGELMLSGTVDGSTVVALVGSEMKEPMLASTVEGASLGELLKGKLADSDHHVRVISGNPLTGTAEGLDGYLRFPYRQVTAIPEGDDVDEFMGWASMSPSKMSTSSSFPGFFFGKKFTPDARILGGRRAMIMSGQYDEYVPMDILTEYLVKAILSRNIEGMEQLGIYEVAPEDFAAAEYADTSKIPLQEIVRDGLNFLRKELE